MSPLGMRVQFSAAEDVALQRPGRLYVGHEVTANRILPCQANSHAVEVVHLCADSLQSGQQSPQRELQNATIVL
jgi:hypothetical protein